MPLLAAILPSSPRSSPGARLQLKWITSAVAATGLTWVTMIVGSVILGDDPVVDVLWMSAILSISFIPIGIGIAVLRYRLYEIDRVISRTLVYGALTAILGGRVRRPRARRAGGLLVVRRRLDLAIAGSTLAVAALFLPLRSRIQASSTGASTAAATTPSGRSSVRRAAARGGRPRDARDATSAASSPRPCSRAHVAVAETGARRGRPDVVARLGLCGAFVVLMRRRDLHPTASPRRRANR